MKVKYILIFTVFLLVDQVGFAQNYKPAVKDVISPKTRYFSIQDVRLLDSPFLHAMNQNEQWMKELDLDRLLSNFRKNANLKPKAEPYGSWESMGIAGHTLGHLLTAMSQHYAATGDETFKAKIDYVVNELDSCQMNFVNGFIGGMPGGDKVFKEVKKGIIRSMGFDLNGIWVPWYNEHKTMMGLNDAYLLAGNETAKKVLINLSDYLADVIAPLSEDQDADGNIWFSTQGKGLFKYNPDKKTWKNYVYSNTPGALVNDQVNCVLIDGNGNMWVGTMNGLCKYDAGEDRFEAIPLDIPSRNICGIVEDQHVLWLTTTKGLVRYAPGESCQVFTRSDGLQSEQFLPNAALKASDGKIYVGSVNGFNAFYPYQIKMNKVLPPVVITGLEIFNKEIRIGDKKLPKALNWMAELDLSYKDHVFSLLYASLSYCTPEKNQYAYKLEGFDKDWNYVGSQNKATYTNLPAGTYVFKVKATNNDGIWSNQEASLKITIHPPFYWSTASKILYFIWVCIALTFFIRFLLKRTEKKHTAEINQLNVSKEKEVHEAKIKFFTMIAHEIRTPVSLIIGPLEKIMKSSIPMPAVLRDDLNIIDRNSQRLLFLVNQLLDFRKVEQEGITMRYASQNIRQLLQAVCERFKPFITQHGAHLEVEYPDADFTAMVDSEAITKMISNLLTNASKYTKDKVVLSCIVQPEQHTFVVKVTDNGIGISKEDRKRIFKPFFQAMDNKPGTGIGLSIVKSIVESHNGCIEVESEINKGSSFIVTLPIEQVGAEVQEGEAGVLNPVIPEDILSETLPVMSSKNKPLMLIVDDNEEMLNFLSSSFSAQYSILTAEDGMEALEKLKEHEVTLIVSDWMMPRMDGVEFCKALRADQSISHIPFILLTAKTDTNSKIEGMDCGADAYIEKPFSVQYLEACIKNLLDLRNLLRQKFSKMPLVPLNSIANNSMDNKFLTRINEIIEQNFSNSELSVDFLAEELCISRSGLFAKIKTLANVTPNELIQIVRLKKAAALLSENKYRINEICYMVGFNNPSYFAKCFQKQFGIKPGEFVNGKE